jgi:Tol biopolymer transport system component
MKIRYFLIISFLSSLNLVAQKQKNAKKDAPVEWNVNSPGAPAQSVSFKLDEGTWMNLDLSPDGSQIVFDLLGDIYTMPSIGGPATCLRSGYAYEVQPRFSPNGKQISFTSDANGADNIWVMDTDGANARQVTKEDVDCSTMPNGRPMESTSSPENTSLQHVLQELANFGCIT